MRSIPRRTTLDAVRRLGRAGRRERPAGWTPKTLPQPAQWAYATSPFFRKVREPLVDVFKEANEVRIIIDLGNFSRRDVSFGRKGDRYWVVARRGEQAFKEEIELPPEADLERMSERFLNGILEINVPRKKGE